ncbi:MAG: signal recognition particle-docking protein FtsY [Candidatus Sumerlaeia bacterium]
MSEHDSNKEPGKPKARGFFSRLWGGGREDGPTPAPNAAEANRSVQDVETSPQAESASFTGGSAAVSASVPAAPAPAPVEAAPAPPSRKSLFERLKERLGKTKKQVVRKIRRAVALHATVSEDLLEEIEDILVQADVGMEATMKIIERLRERVEEEHIKDPGQIIPALKDIIRGMLTTGGRSFAIGPQRPFVILVTGVNGTGKTTTIGKMAARFRSEGYSVMLIAADTFRAAAIDQLAVWAERSGATLIRQHEGADAAAVCFDGLQAAVGRGVDVVLIDTAGRLHTKVNLMKELGKVDKVIKKVLPDAPHETLLVVDATTGQNALNQALTFSETTPLTGLVMTKLDGTAKGGILLALRERVNVPVYFIGVGEQIEDLRDFDADEFVEALFSVEEADNDMSGDD